MYVHKRRKIGQLKSFGKGRVCKKYGCKQRLSIYNSALYCHLHGKEFIDSPQ